MATLKNLYHLRRVADSSAKPCFICYRPATNVLITPDQSVTDFFYTCPGHLLDRGFASPVGPSAEELKAEAEREVERVKREYEEKKKEKEKKKKKAEGEKDKDGSDKEKSKDEGKKKKEEEKTAEPEKVEDPRVFTLHKKVYDMRVARIRQLQQAKRDRERLRSGNLFPSVPKGEPGR